MADTPSRVTTQNRVALLASTSLPWTTSSPSVSSRRASSSVSSGCPGRPKLAAGSLLPVTEPVSPSGAPAVAIGPGADVSVRVEWLAAERAWRAPCLHDGPGPLHECAGHRARDAHPHDVRAVLLVVEVDFLFLFGGGPGFDDDPLALLVPGERHGTDPKLLGERRFERREVVELARCYRRHGGGATAAPEHLVQQLIHTLGEHPDLLLLQRDTGHASARGCLQVEDTLTGRADSARDETVGRVELEDLTGHNTSLCISARRFAQAPAPPPTTASESDVRRLRPGRRLGGSNPSTEPPTSLSRTTNGRRSVYRMTVTEHGSIWMRWN